MTHEDLISVGSDWTMQYGLKYKVHGPNTGLIFPKIHPFHGFDEKKIQAFGLLKAQQLYMFIKVFSILKQSMSATHVRKV